MDRVCLKTERNEMRKNRIKMHWGRFDVRQQQQQQAAAGLRWAGGSRQAAGSW